MTFLKTLITPAARKAQVAFVTSAFGLAAVFGFTNPSLEAGILSTLAGIANVILVYARTNE